MRSINLGINYERPVAGRVIPGMQRWIGRCKKCGATRKVEGELALMYAPPQVRTAEPFAGSQRRSGTDFVIKAADGLYTAGDRAGEGGNMSYVRVPCGDHWITLERVVEGKKNSKHTCGSRCTNSTGPNCDCRCKGANHGSNC